MPGPKQTFSVEELVGQADSAAVTAPKKALRILCRAARRVVGESTPLAAIIAAKTAHMQHITGSYTDSRTAFDKAEALFEGLPPDEYLQQRAQLLCNYANLLCDLGAYRPARERMEACIEIDRCTIGTDSPEHGRTLANFARILVATGAPGEACHILRLAIGLLAASTLPRDQLHALYAKNLLGIALMYSGAWAAALGQFRTLSGPAEETGDAVLSYSVRNNIGWTLYQTGDYQAALFWQEEALRNAKQQRGDAGRADEATVLTNVGAINHKLGDYEAACENYTAAALVLKSIAPNGRHPQIASILCNWGQSLYRLDRYEEARQKYHEALSLRLDINGEAHEETTDVRCQLAELSLIEGAVDDALQQTLVLLVQPCLYFNQDRTWRIFNLIGRSLAAQGRRALAILFAKEAVVIIEALRLEVVEFGRGAEDKFARSRAAGYRDLADHLLADHRLSEAEQAFARLRTAEHNELFGRDSDHRAQSIFSLQETEWRKIYGATLAKIVMYCGQLNEQTQAGDKPEHLAALRLVVEETALMLSNAIAELILRTPPDPVSVPSDMTMADHDPILGSDEIFLHYVPAGTHILLLHRDADGIISRRQIDTDEASLNLMIFKFRQLLTDPHSSVETLHQIGEQLYILLLGPVFGMALASGRIVFWLDGTLRFLPPAALFDGSKYLIERAEVTIYSPFAVTTPPTRSLHGQGVAGFALAHGYEGFQPLPYSIVEVEAVVRQPPDGGLFDGERFFDARFTPENLERTAGIFGGLLIASHFVLMPAEMTSSGLLTGTGHLMPVRQLAALDYSGLSLVTMSGCDTGTAGLNGDVATLQSLADRLLLRGAGAVLASLWQVADESCAQLITEFYAILASDSATNLATALRQAQITILNNASFQRRFETDAERGIGSPIGIAPGFIHRRHPYYWAPFILLGNTSGSQVFAN